MYIVKKLTLISKRTHAHAHAHAHMHTHLYTVRITKVRHVPEYTHTRVYAKTGYIQ